MIGNTGLEMNVETFLATLKDFSFRYINWWYPQFSELKEKYSKANPTFNYDTWRKTFNDFETERRAQNDVIGEFYEFVDNNYDVYLFATLEECEKIREAVTDCIYNERGKSNRFLEDLFFRYAKERAIPNLKETGDKNWLTKGLVAISLENSGIDYRDSILALSELRKVAILKNIDPEPEFIRIARISSNEIPRGGSIPMRELMTKNIK